MVEEAVEMEPWEVQLCKEMRELTDGYTKRWTSIVRKLGIQGADREGWVKIFKDNSEELLSEILLDASQVQENVIQRIESLLKQCQDLCKKLSIKMPPYGSESHGLYEEEKLLQVKFLELQEKVAVRRKQLAILYKRESVFCISLGQESKQLSEDPLPSEEQIDNYVKYIDSLENEKFVREESFLAIKDQVIEITQELNFKPTLDFEKLVLSEDNSSFVYSDQNMKRLNDFHKSIFNQLEYTKQEIVGVRETLRNLWAILEEDLVICDAFLQRHPGNSYDTLEALKLEVKRCEFVKKSNIEIFVNKYRQEISLFWDKCRFSPEQRQEFQYFYDDLYTEDLLTLHTMEIDKLKRYYDKNSDIFDLLRKRDELWEKKLELEDKEVSNKDRYKNRGGQLLKEEKERNAIYKRIPKIEDQLLQMAASYEIKNGTPFLSYGETIEHIIEKSRENHDQDKKNKLSARKQQREMTFTPGLSIAPGSSMKSTTILADRTPNKRKIATPLFSAKRARPLTESNKKIGIRSAPPRILLNDKSINKKAPRYSSEKNKRMDRLRRLSKMYKQTKKPEDSANSTTTSYDYFEKELSSKDAHRSTTLFSNDNSETPLAIPLDATPIRKPLKPSTPRRTPSSKKNASKFSAAPGSNLFL